MLDSEIQQYLTYTGFLLRAVATQLPELISVIKESSAGYPTGHEGRTELDENDEAVTYDSRTQSAALHPDPARDARKDLERNVKALRNAAVNLDGLRQAWLTTTKDRPKGDGEPGCTSCNRLKMWAPVHRDGRCKWCYEWWLANKQEPPIPLLRAHHEGRRITSALERRLMGKKAG